MQLTTKQERRHAVRVRVSDAERNYLQEEAARTDRSVSAVLRLALKEYYDRRVEKMTPVVSWEPADYYLAIDRARLAWQRSQPQLTIDGVLDEVDVARADAAGTAAASISSSASSHRLPPIDGGAGALDINDNGPGRIAPQRSRGQGHWR